MAKKIDPIKAKAKRDKIVAAVLGGVLLVALVVAVPMTLKQWKKLNGGDQAQPTPVQTTPVPGTTAAPGVAPTGASGGIASTISAPLATGQLHAFDLFESKDPFEPQVDVSAAAPVQATTVPQTPSANGALRPTAGAASAGAPPAGATPRAPPVVPTSAVMSVNGAPAELLGIGVEFPLPPAEPLFRLESLAPGRARISIVGGSYASGAATVTVKVGKTLTLENTADGTRYELKLLWVGSGTPPPGLVPAPPTAAAPTATPSTPTSTP
jgi:hypothetical protein